MPYYDHQEEIERILIEGDALAESIGTSATELQQRIKTRMKAKEDF